MDKKHVEELSNVIGSLSEVQAKFALRYLLYYYSYGENTTKELDKIEFVLKKAVEENE